MNCGEPSILRAADINELYIEACKAVVNHGRGRSARDLPTIELPYVMLVLEDPTRSIVTLPQRHEGRRLYTYLEAEHKWYLSGSTNVTGIVAAAPFWKKLADSNGTINSNYGYLALKRKSAGKSQLEWCIDSLQQDRETRQAVITYLLPEHKYPGNRDVPCTLDQHFLVIDDKLDSKVTMRGNDLLLGFPSDIAWFTFLQAEVSRAIGIPLGKYVHDVHSLHFYERDRAMIERIAASEIDPVQQSLAEQVWKEWTTYTSGKTVSFVGALRGLGIIQS